MSAAHAVRAHARLSPSGAHRWLACPGSIALAEELVVPSSTSAAAEEGTAAHELLELALTSGKSPHAFIGRTVNLLHTVDDRMATAVKLAVETVRPMLSACSIFGYETPISIGATGEGGTVDAWGYCPGSRTLWVWDYKNGRGIVEAKGNPQGRLYALGLLENLEKARHTVDRIVVGILQPHSPDGDSYKTEELTPKTLRAWVAATVDPVVRSIKAGTARCVAGDQCQNCKCAGRCPTLNRAGAEAARMDWADFTNPKATMAEKPLTLKELGAVLHRLPALRALVKEAELEALRLLAKSPKNLPGWKLVEGRTKRRWSDKAEATLRKLGLDLDEILPRSLAPIGEVAPLLPPKKREAILSKITIKPTGRPTLAQASDPRPTILGNALQDFADELNPNPED